MADSCVDLCWFLILCRSPFPPLLLSFLSSPSFAMSNDPTYDESADEPYHGDRWGMYSAAGDDEVDEILWSATTWDDLLAKIDAAKHREIHDTAVRDRVYERFEENLQAKADAGGAPFESYEDYCQRWTERVAAAQAANAAKAAAAGKSADKADKQ